ncbi:MAG: Stp1/IreP family PP2C-type Ser/Thr phosphatase [Defluviitaleaceae bacterium]|nr:Stp1/IreP family PP2C-type Ser/Thr phosphatase [Defluviitaleaceae bacterium]
MLNVSAKTDIGKKRAINQDTVFALAEPVGPLPNLFIVADGMGGHNGGEIASQVAIAHFCKHIESHGSILKSGVLDLLTSAANAANAEVFSQSKIHSDLTGMGTTLTACTIDNGKCSIIHVGDSRAYAVTGDGITQLTSDHSYVNEMVKAGQMSPAEAREHPKRNVLTQVLGPNAEMSADGYIVDVEPGSVILLCSDGLYNMVSEEEIKHLINTSQKPAIALVDAANAQGGTDNITVVVVKIEVTP